MFDKVEGWGGVMSGGAAGWRIGLKRSAHKHILKLDGRSWLSAPARPSLYNVT
jgi:hypothetical protein